MELNKDFIVARALDNRIGGFMIAEVARLLKENKKKLPFTLYVVNSVQEEIGLRGAEMISRRLKPDVAIVTDVTHDTSSPMYSKKDQGDIACGRGPTLTIGPAVHNNVLKMLEEVAEKNKIPYQRHATSRSTGTCTEISNLLYEYPVPLGQAKCICRGQNSIRIPCMFCFLETKYNKSPFPSGCNYSIVHCMLVERSPVKYIVLPPPLYA